MTLPEGWLTAKLGTLTAKIGSGATPKGGRENYEKVGTPLIRSMNVHFRGFRSDGLAYLDDQQANSLKNVAVFPQDVLLNITGASIGRVCLVPDELAGARVNQHVCIIRLLQGISPRYVEAYLSSPHVQRFVHQANYGVTRQALTKGMIEQIQLPIPPLAEQRRIVTKLDALNLRIARARRELENVNSSVLRLRSKVLRSVFGKFNCSRMPLSDVLIEMSYGTAKKCEYEGGVTPVLRIPNIQNGGIDLCNLKFADFDNKELEKLSLEIGDILVIRSNGSISLVGRSAVVSEKERGMLYAGYLIRLRLNQKRCLPKYLQFFLQSESARTTLETAARSTSGVHNINTEHLRSLVLPLPNLDAQMEAVKRLEAAFARADSIEAEAVRATALLDRWETSILAKAFRGELVPQDPVDEPATALLDRIFAESVAAPKTKRGGLAATAANS